MDEPEKKWVHWCEACKAWVAHVNAHGVSENEALLSRIATLDTALAASRAEAEHANEKLVIANEAALQMEDEIEHAERRVKEWEEAVTYLFTPGPGIAVPEPYPKQEEYEPHKKTWNLKLAKLRALLTPPPVAPSGGHSA